VHRTIRQICGEPETLSRNQRLQRVLSHDISSLPCGLLYLLIFQSRKNTPTLARRPCAHCDRGLSLPYVRLQSQLTRTATSSLSATSNFSLGTGIELADRHPAVYRSPQIRWLSTWLAYNKYFWAEANIQPFGPIQLSGPSVGAPIPNFVCDLSNTFPLLLIFCKMSRSPTSSVEPDTVEETTKVPVVVAGALGPAPMPSLTSHPPLRLQRKPVPGTILKELPGTSSPISHPLPPRTPSQADSPAYDAESPPLIQENSTEENLIPCPFCPAVFKKVGHLNRHTLKHAGTRFPCDVAGCDKTFSRLDNMRTQ
jgi:Zinc finger, C2H2 type